MTTLETLAEALFRLELDQLPGSSLHAASRCLLDALACAAAGRRHAAVRHARAWAESTFRPGPANLWFEGQSLAPVGAGFVNAYAASILDVDDGHRGASGHPGAAIVPAVIAGAEGLGRGVSLGEVLLAIVCGYEAGVRIARARTSDQGARASVATGRWSAAGVAAAVGKLHRLDLERLTDAIAIAEAQAPNLLAADHSGFMGGDTKEGIPWSLLAGMAAVDQAALGLKGYRAALDNPAVYIPGAATGGFGAHYLVESTYFKLYGCCRWTHSAIDAVLEMRREGIPPDRVDRIEIATFQRALSLQNLTRPMDLIAAQFSLPFAVAAALVAGPEALLPLTPNLLTEADILRLAERVHLALDPALDACFPAQVPARVTLIAGAQRLEREVRVPLGDPANPLPDERLIQKAVTLLGESRPEGQVRALAEHLLGDRTGCGPGGPDLLATLRALLIRAQGTGAHQ
jgi:2-methylcitrate dehydratase PrpD